MADPPVGPIQPMAFLYGDYACPYSYVADARLAILASEGALTVSWRPLPTLGLKAVGDWSGLCEDPAHVEAGVEELGRGAAQMGLPFRLPDSPPSTERAIEACEFARDCGPDDFRRFHRALFRAVFSEGLDIGNLLVLADVAEREGIDATGLNAALEDGRYRCVLEEVEAEADRYGITSTPTILMGKWKLVGAAPLDVMRSTLLRVSRS